MAARPSKIFSDGIHPCNNVAQPSRILLILKSAGIFGEGHSLGIVYTLLVAAFGVGVWETAGRSGPLHVLGSLLIVSGIVGLGWLPAL